MYTFNYMLVLFPIFIMPSTAYVPLKIKRSDVGHSPETKHLNGARREILKLTDKIKFAVPQSDRVSEEQPIDLKEGKTISLSDFFNEHGMLFLTQPKYNEIRVLNKAINKAIAMKYTGANSLDELSSQELQILDGVVSGLSGRSLRTKNSEKPGITYNFEELVA